MKKSIFNTDIRPFYQGGIVVASTLIISVFLKLISLIGITEIEPLSYWIIGAAFVLFFAMFNSLLSLSTKKPNSYWGESIFTYFFVVVITSLVAYVLSSLSIYEAASMKWIYIVLSLVYIIFLSIVRLMKTIVQIAIKQDKKLRGEE